MKILVTGATGYVGRRLCLQLIREGHEIVAVTRNNKDLAKRLPFPCEVIEGDLNTAPITSDKLDSIDYVIHLAGEPVAGSRWTEKQKEMIKGSRVQGTKNLLSSFKGKSLQGIVSASAIGIYGDTGDQEVTEDSPHGTDFLADVCAGWESACKEGAEALGIPAAMIRIGLVIGEESGFMNNLSPIFESGFGGKLGSGKQWMSWIHIDDLLRIFLDCLNKKASGIFNGTAPHPVTNQEFTKTYAECLNTSAFFPVPKFALHLAVGKMAEVILASQKVLPQVLVQTGFQFQYTHLKEALTELIGDFPRHKIKTCLQWVPYSRSEVFEFFAEAKNLERITPDFLNFKIKDMSDSEIKKGTLIDYTLKLHGIPMGWRTEIKEWNPPHHFVDNQLKGPYSTWHHLHTFEELAGGTLIADKVYYRLPMGTLGQSVAGSFVRGDVDMIFNYRFQSIQEIFPPK